MKKNKEFDIFIQDVYQAASVHTWEENVLGHTITRPSIYGRVYIANSSPSFQEIAEDEKGEGNPIKAFISRYSISPDMLYLKSQKTGEDLQVYEYEYGGHSILNDQVIITLRNRTVTFPL